MKEKELKELKLTKNIIIPFPNFQQNTIISPTQMNDNFEEIEHAYNTLIDNHNGAITKINKALSDITSTDNDAISNEQARVQAEETRVQNEEERVANEEERKTEEKKRIAMYNTHLNDELRREQKHTEMVNTFDTKVIEVNTFVDTKKEEINSFVSTKTEEVEEFVDLKTNQVDSFITTKTTEVNAFVTAKGQEVQNAINAIPPKSELIGEKGDKGDKGEKGDKGDRGEQGIQGIQGIQGLQGVKGDKGDKGEQGIQGLKGDKGDKGDRGEQGVKGDTPSITHLETSINNKIQEVETRFNTLTSAQQQSSEVIDARDGETSLKARLDRDIEKAKQVYVNVEGSHISTDSSSGYLKDVEILGNTIQDASNLADIRSVGDKVEGQELYEIPVVSCGKNLFIDAIYKKEDTNGWSPKIKIDKTKSYVCKYGSSVKTPYIRLFDENLTKIPFNESFSIAGKVIENASYFSIQYVNSLTNIQLEEGTQATPYEPYVEDKLTILSPVQLEKVGDVSDRIIEKDGVWGVEKNIINVAITPSISLNTYSPGTTSEYNGALFNLPTLKPIAQTPICNKIIGRDNPINPSIGEGISILSNQYVYIILAKDKGDVKTWCVNNNVWFKCITTQPQFIPLPHDQQVKLRTFANKTNISFLTEIEGTIKAQVPKSLGATVNTHTEQINNLNKELDRVKKLEESTVSTVTTESDFTTVEATSNGYFEDVKLEGRTLVNLCCRTYSIFRFADGVKTDTHVLSVDSLSKDAYTGIHFSNTVESGKTYTLVMDIDDISGAKYAFSPAILYPGGSDSFAKISPSFKGLYVSKIIASKSIVSEDVNLVTNNRGFRIGVDGKQGGTFKIKTIVILEGDHTQNPPNGYIEGLKSVGQSATTSEDGADEIVVTSVKGDGNLVEYIELNGVIIANGKDYTDNKYVRTNYIIVEPNQTYYIKLPINVLYKGCTVYFYDSNKSYLGYKSGLTSEFTTVANTKFIRIDMKKADNTDNTQEDINNCDFVVSKCRVSEYIPYQSDKKRLLFYNNETQTWEKPILREWDSIEKHSNGKYYYHQRSAEVVLDGSEDEGWSNHTASDNYISFMPGARVWDKNQIVVCDKFKPVVWSAGATDEFIWSFTQSCGICIAKSKLSTQDVAGFKAWLQANPVTVVYQLAQEKVYECTNIDLITYANETNYIVESGAIVPRSTLKVHNNISNVVRTLQEKVSLLEDKFIMGLKQVLAGDMYSLAELLYPEDFVSKEEPIDVPTLLI